LPACQRVKNPNSREQLLSQSLDIILSIIVSDHLLTPFKHWRHFDT